VAWLLDLSQKEIVCQSLLNYNGILPSPNMSQLREYIEKHPSETQRLLGLDYDQLMGLIINAENLYARQKKYQESQKTRIIKPGSGRPPKLTIADQIILTISIPASPTNLSNPRCTVWNWRINC
jgi:hypothetical protein